MIIHVIDLQQNKCLFCGFLLQEALEPPLKLVTVFFGANDAALKDRIHQNQHVPLQEYKENLLSIISHVKVSLPPYILIMISMHANISQGLCSPFWPIHFPTLYFCYSFVHA